MSELAFAITTIALLFVVAIPTTTVLAKLVLIAKRRRSPEITHYGSSWGYLYVIAPVIIPVLWVVSAALHQSEPGGALGTCLDDDSLDAICIGALGLAGSITLFSVVMATTVPGRKTPPAHDSATSRTQRARIQRVIAADPVLRRWRSRVLVVERQPTPACVRGLLRPQVEMSLEYMDRIDDEMLHAVLLHEVEHAVCGDPLRTLLAEVAMRLNPLAALLRVEFARWKLAREVACDRHAIRLGADRVALAEALVAGARHDRPCSAFPALRSTERDALELRVRLLLDESWPDCGCGSRRGVLTALVLLATVAAVPHLIGSEPLDSFHRAVDEAVLRPLG